MKRLYMLPLAAATLLPSSVMAVEVTDTVTNRKEFTAAITKANSAAAGDVYKIVCKWEAGSALKIDNVKPTMKAGKLIITSDETEYSKMPQMLIGLEWAGDLDDNGNFALVIENVGLQYRAGNTATSGQIVYFNKRDAQMDSLVIRNCDISNYPRTVYRAVPKSSDAVKNIGKLVFENNLVHDATISARNNWAVIYPGQAVNEVVIKNNLFYNLPYTTAIFQMGYANEGTGTTPMFTFENNTVMQAASNSMAKGFDVINTGSYFTAGTFNINNNLFIAPQKGEYSSIQVNDTANFQGTSKILNANNAIVNANNNVVDAAGFLPIEDCDPGKGTSEKATENAWYLSEVKNSYSLEDAGITSWDEGVVFQSAAESQYYMQKSAKTYTMGVDGTFIGSANTYVDQFPVKAAVNITINGPKYITYTLTPEKTTYYVGDDVTVTLNTHTNHYLPINTFTGWSDGSTDASRTFTLTGDLNETASFTTPYTAENQLISSFDFKAVTGKNMTSYDADAFLEGYQAKVTGVVNDTASSKVAPFAYIDGAFQTRSAKFGEDAEELQQAIISRRTWSGAKAVQRDYVVFAFPTKSLSDVNFSCYVGTDNNAAKVQALEYSLDKQSWTRLAEVEIENGQWSQLKGTLPADLNGKEEVYVRVIGDMKNGAVVTPDESIGMWDGSAIVEDVYNASDAFEYLGSVLITANVSSTGIVNVKGDSSLDADAPIYNLLGVKVAKGTKGILIQNGKKFVVK